VKRFRGELAFEAHRALSRSTFGSRVRKKKNNDLVDVALFDEALEVFFELSLRLLVQHVHLITRILLSSEFATKARIGP
jgi:hypothetical protein